MNTKCFILLSAICIRKGSRCNRDITLMELA
jgi:hypothetical protein